MCMSVSKHAATATLHRCEACVANASVHLACACMHAMAISDSSLLPLPLSPPSGSHGAGEADGPCRPAETCQNWQATSTLRETAKLKNCPVQPGHCGLIMSKQQGHPGFIRLCA